MMMSFLESYLPVVNKNFKSKTKIHSKEMKFKVIVKGNVL